MSAPNMPVAKRPRTESAPAGGDELSRGILALNSLHYSVPQDLSVTVSRTHLKSFFSQNSYTQGQRAICVSNSGGAFVNLTTSYLTLTVTNDTAAKMSWGGGSVCNLFAQTALTSRDGTSIELNQRANAWSLIHSNVFREPGWRDTIGQCIGMKPTVTNAGATNRNEILAGASMTYQIPLSCLFSLAREDQLMPSALLSGLRFELTFETGTYAAVWSENPLGKSYTISDISISLDSCTLSDSASRSLQMQAAQGGLTIGFTSVHNSQSPLKQGSSVDEIRKSASRMLSVFMLIRPSEGNDPWQTDFFKTPAFNLKSFQIRLGSLLFPSAPIGNTVAQCESELYLNTVRSIGSMISNPSPLSYDRWAGRSSAVDGLGVICTSLERGDASKGSNSGISCNSSRTLTVSYSTDAPDGNFTVDFFSCYSSIIQCFLNNISLAA